MNLKQKNALKGIALAVLVAGGTGIVRVADGAQHWLRKISAKVSADVNDIRTIMNADHEEAVGDGLSLK